MSRPWRATGRRDVGTDRGGPGGDPRTGVGEDGHPAGGRPARYRRRRRPAGRPAPPPSAGSSGRPARRTPPAPPGAGSARPPVAGLLSSPRRARSTSAPPIRPTAASSAVVSTSSPRSMLNEPYGTVRKKSNARAVTTPTTTPTSRPPRPPPPARPAPGRARGWRCSCAPAAGRGCHRRYRHHHCVADAKHHHQHGDTTRRPATALTRSLRSDRCAERIGQRAAAGDHAAGELPHVDTD